MKNIYLLIPAYNAADEIEELLKQVIKYIPEEQIVVVDDGSTDDTVSIIEDWGVKLISHESNLGKGEAILTGFENLLINPDVEWIITIDSDLQHDPAMIPSFAEYAQTGKYDMIIGNRLKSKAMPWDRRFSNWCTSLLISLICRERIYDSQCGFRIIRTRLLYGMAFWAKRFEIETELILNFNALSARIGWIDIPTIYRESGSNINRVSDTFRFLRFVLKFIIRSIMY